MTLLHYLVEEAEKTDKHVLQFADDLKQPLTAANRCGVFNFFIHLCLDLEGAPSDQIFVEYLVNVNIIITLFFVITYFNFWKLFNFNPQT